VSDDSPPEDAGQALAARPDQESLDRFLEVQTRELELRKSELDIRREELNVRREESRQGYEFAQQSLRAQAEDLKEVRKGERRDSSYLLITILAALITLAVVLLVSLYWNKEQFVLELVRVILAALGGGGVGYAAGRKKKDKPSDE
jgi:hypothetical protein